MNSTVVTIPDDVVSKTGPRIIGYLLHWGLFGALCMRVYLYYLGFPKDPIRNKIFVFSVFGLEIMQTIIITQSAFHVFGSGYGHFEAYDSINLAWFSVPILSGMVAFLAEMFYAYRIRILSGSYKASTVISTLAFVQLGGAIATAVTLKQAGTFSRLLNPHFFITASIWNGGSALCDVIIAAYMTFYLSRRSGPNSLQATKVLLHKLIRIVIETGTITAAIAMVNLILVLLPSHPSYFEVPSEVLAKVYSNSMMAVLNSRMKLNTDEYEPNSPIGQIRGMEDETVDSDGSSQGTTAGGGRRDGDNSSQLSGGVLVTRERVVFPDYDTAEIMKKYYADEKEGSGMKNEARRLRKVETKRRIRRLEKFHRKLELWIRRTYEKQPASSLTYMDLNACAKIGQLEDYCDMKKYLLGIDYQLRDKPGGLWISGKYPEQIVLYKALRHLYHFLEAREFLSRIDREGDWRMGSMTAP
ncbi:hypothetical protein BDN70DRAFT_929402 [Pholiota conissans]|uniref:DUF6534 domain-containing protein n=1 Tax=Pholiota conissans TaxID=109636 RepID=A0A9P6CWR8_9AGAR|nr:hypothetical protein BDN70DRAFT_929402 [Pholiota conissans]